MAIASIPANDARERAGEEFPPTVTLIAAESDNGTVDLDFGDDHCPVGAIG